MIRTLDNCQGVSKRIDGPFSIISDVLGRKKSISLTRKTAMPALERITNIVNLTWQEFLEKKRIQLSLDKSDLSAANDADLQTDEFFLAVGGTSIDASEFVSRLMQHLPATAQKQRKSNPIFPRKTCHRC